MPKVKISEYSATANSNTDVASINIDEGCAPSGINNAIRAVMGHLKDFQQGTNGDPFNGPVNGTVGATTPASGAFTTLSATGNVTLGDASTDTLNVGNGGLIKDASGNLGLGVTPKTIDVGKSFEIGVAGSGLWSSMAATDIRMMSNVYYNSGYKFAGTGYAAVFLANGGAFAWQRSSASGTVGNAVTASDVMTLDVNGNLLVGTTTSTSRLVVATKAAGTNTITLVGGLASNFTGDSAINFQGYNSSGGFGATGTILVTQDASGNTSAGRMTFSTSAAGGVGEVERARIDSSGVLMVGTTTTDPYSTNSAGISFGLVKGLGIFSRDGGDVVAINRKTNDGTLVLFGQDGTTEGTISVSGTTVSYNGGHLSRWAQTTTAKDDSLVKGTVLSNLDEMNVYTDADGNPVDNEQLNKVKVSDTEGDVNVAGVFVNWSYDEQHSVDEINMAMTGDMIIRIAQGTTVARGDLLMSAGDGTAKPQGDDIVRSKTVAKVTSNHVTCTYADGSYCVPCVLMAC